MISNRCKNIISSFFSISPFIFSVLLILTVSHRALVMDGTTPDAIHYMDVAKNLLEGKGTTTFMMNLSSKNIPAKEMIFQPLFPHVIKVFASLFQNSDFSTILLASRILSYVFFLSALAIFIFIIWKHAGKSTGMIFLALMMVNYNFLKFPSWILTENLYLFLFSLIVLIMVRKDSEKKITSVAAAAFLCALLFFTRYVGVSASISVFVYLLIKLFKFKGKEKKTIFINLIVFSVLSAVVMLVMFFSFSLQTGSVISLRPTYSQGIWPVFLSIADYTLNVFFYFSFCPLLWAPVLLVTGYIIFKNIKIKRTVFYKKMFASDLHLFFLIYIIMYSITLFLMSMTVDITLGISRFIRLNLPVIALLFISLFQSLAGEDKKYQKLMLRTFMLFCFVVFLRQAVKHSALYPPRVNSYLTSKREKSLEQTEMIWMEDNNIDENDLVVSLGAFIYRFYFNCMVIESGYPEHPKIEYKSLKNFLEHHKEDLRKNSIKNIYIVIKRFEAEKSPFARNLVEKKNAYAKTMVFEKETKDTVIYKWRY